MQIEGGRILRDAPALLYTPRQLLLNHTRHAKEFPRAFHIYNNRGRE